MIRSRPRILAQLYCNCEVPCYALTVGCPNCIAHPAVVRGIYEPESAECGYDEQRIAFLCELCVSAVNTPRFGLECFRLYDWNLFIAGIEYWGARGEYCAGDC